MLVRVRTALNLLARFTEDIDVTDRALAGVARLAGLTAPEGAELRSSTEARFPLVAEIAWDERASEPERAESAPAAPEDPDPESTDHDLARALSAAQAVIDGDGYTRRPGKRSRRVLLRAYPRRMNRMMHCAPLRCLRN